MSDLVARRSPHWARRPRPELDLSAALEDEHDAFWLAANDRAAFAELTQVALGVAQISVGGAAGCCRLNTVLKYSGSFCGG